MTRGRSYVYWIASSIWAPAVLLVVSLALFEVTDLDLALQDRFYDFSAGAWIVDGREPVGRLVFYSGPKLLVIALGVALLVLISGPARWRDHLSLERRALAVAVLTLTTVPLLAGLGKRMTNTFCPSEVRRYGGEFPYVKLLEAYPAEDLPATRGHCFPAGHASGGFALVGILWLRASRRWRLAAIATAAALGLIMGGYQMLKGAHYLSHTIATLLLAWLVTEVWAKVIGVQ